MSGLLEWHKKTGFRYWGEGAKARKEREDRIAAGLRALTTEPAREFEALPTQAQNPMGAFSLYAPPNPDARRRKADEALAKLGYKPRR